MVSDIRDDMPKIWEETGGKVRSVSRTLLYRQTENAYSYLGSDKLSHPGFQGVL